MNNIVVSNYQTVNGDAEVRFQDGSVLTLAPSIRLGNIIGFDRAILHRNGELEALCEEGEGVWTKGSVTPQALAEYWSAAIQAADDAYQRLRECKIDQATWDTQHWAYYTIAQQGQDTLKALGQGELPVLEQVPERFKERV